MKLSGVRNVFSISVASEHFFCLVLVCLLLLFAYLFVFCCFDFFRFTYVKEKNGERGGMLK